MHDGGRHWYYLETSLRFDLTYIQVLVHVFAQFCQVANMPLDWKRVLGGYSIWLRTIN